MKARLFNYVSGLHSVYQTRKAMTLYNQGLYNTLASSLKTLEEYRRVKIGGYPLVAWLIGNAVPTQRRRIKTVWESSWGMSSTRGKS